MHKIKLCVTSRIPLRSRIRMTFKCETGMSSRISVLAGHGCDVQSLYPRSFVRQAAIFGLGTRQSRLDMRLVGNPNQTTMYMSRSSASAAHFDVLPGVSQNFLDAQAFCSLNLAPSGMESRLWSTRRCVRMLLGKLGSLSALFLHRKLCSRLDFQVCVVFTVDGALSHEC